MPSRRAGSPRAAWRRALGGRTRLGSAGLAGRRSPVFLAERAERAGPGARG